MEATGTTSKTDAKNFLKNFPRKTLEKKQTMSASLFAAVVGSWRLRNVLLNSAYNVISTSVVARALTCGAEIVSR